MIAVDFMYDGQCLSDYGFIICNFDYKNGTDVVSAGSEISFEKVSRNGGKHYSISSTKYESCIETEFDICKNPDTNGNDKMEITEDEFRNLMRWLNRHTFYRFNLLNESRDNSNVPARYYNASFNLSKIFIGDKLYGIRCHMNTDRPFGVGDKIHSVIHTTNQKSAGCIFVDYSDEIGITYPVTIITIKGSGDLTITNISDNSVVSIKNCTSGEKITMSGDTLMISTSKGSHNIANDFNYEFFRISNDFGRRENYITSSIPCDIEIEYSPIIKDIP